MARHVTFLLLVVAAVSIAGCSASATPKGGNYKSDLGAQDTVGSARAGDCIGTSKQEPGTARSHPQYYCGPYAKQWCREHPGEAPTEGSCDGVPGWSQSSSSAAAGASPGGAGSAQSAATRCTVPSGRKST